MPTSPPVELFLLPGQLLVTFLVRLGGAASALVVPPSEFMEGLRAALDLLGFAELVRDDDRIDDLLPWAGNV